MTLALPSRRAALMPGQWVGNALWRSAKAVPSLDLRFAESKSLVDSRTGQNLATFTRASSATYVGSDGLIKTAAVNEPRFDHNPTTGESLGLLVEEQRTNLLLRSEEFDNASWVPGAATLTANAISSPTGSAGADLLRASSTGSAVRFIVQTSSKSSTAIQYTFSVYLKAKEVTFATFSCDDSLGNGFSGGVNLSTGATSGAAVGTGAIFSSVAAVSVGNGWYRCSVTGTSNTTANVRVAVNLATSLTAGYPTVTLNANDGLYLWGAQLEVGAFPTSYIPTTTATVTRSADVASITGANFSSWYRQDEGTVFADVALAQPNSGGNQFVFRASDNGYNNSVAWNIQSSGFSSLATAAGGVFDGIASSVTALTANLPAKFAAGYQANNLALSLSGATSVIDISATLPTALTRADIGSDHAGVNRVKAGTIRRLTYWPIRLPNSTLEAITR